VDGPKHLFKFLKKHYPLLQSYSAASPRPLDRPARARRPLCPSRPRLHRRLPLPRTRSSPSLPTGAAAGSRLHRRLPLPCTHSSPSLPVPLLRTGLPLRPCGSCSSSQQYFVVLAWPSGRAVPAPPASSTCLPSAKSCFVYNVLRLAWGFCLDFILPYVSRPLFMISIL
jgi:hypothetical protein